jgi:hypothetical protein
MGSLFLLIYSHLNDYRFTPPPCGDFKQEIPMDWFQGTIDPIENPDNNEDRKIKNILLWENSKR